MVNILNRIAAFVKMSDLAGQGVCKVRIATLQQGNVNTFAAKMSQEVVRGGSIFECWMSPLILLADFAKALPSFYDGLTHFSHYGMIYSNCSDFPNHCCPDQQ
jgi:hypothetical protein